MSRRLLLALACSLLLHAAPFVPGLIPPPPPPQQPPPIQATLQPPPPPLPPAPELKLEEPPKPTKAEPPKPPQPEKRLTTAKPSPQRAATWQEEVSRQFRQQNERDEYYPREAIAAGQQGDVLVLIILDETGNVVATRRERSSSHAILDEAALRNARRLHGLPADAPREAVLTVRFRLR